MNHEFVLFNIVKCRIIIVVCLQLYQVMDNFELMKLFCEGFSPTENQETEMLQIYNNVHIFKTNYLFNNLTEVDLSKLIILSYRFQIPYRFFPSIQLYYIYIFTYKYISFALTINIFILVSSIFCEIEKIISLFYR